MDAQIAAPSSSGPVPQTDMLQQTDAEINAAKPYTFRRLNSSDVFLMVSILSKIGINEWIPCIQSPNVLKLIHSLFEKSGENADKKTEKDSSSQTDISDREFLAGMGVVMEIVNIVFMNLSKCKEDIYRLLSSVSGISTSDIEVMDAEVFINMLVDFIRKEEFKGFIRAALRLTGLD